ncbi:pak-box/p21-Rho-binding protein [Niveomyces insectorum RCEF 264]|uniref:Pak-box/p21-Rho-binding protein n=1 Tax=Niveomyces insectorum RCEF 264 TaxID=1081102 RepID=A0A167M1Z3_9HYPO|nr:pak-box/p21-Rho-binding protein [Niveomyces insectorum RCEF 264]
MAPSSHHSGNIAELLEPAIEGPPSPESIRAFSNQMRWASAMDKHQSQQSRQSHQTTSSGSSSLRSLTSADRPSWDHSFDGPVSLSRKSSGRSVSSVQPRDRLDGVQIFGKSLFGKRGRLRRESSAQSSSNSSLYSAETPYDKGAVMAQPPPTTSHGLTTSASKEALVPTFFNRRRAHKSGPPSEDLDNRRRLQISGPYNFQHLTHTQQQQQQQQQQLPTSQRGSRGSLRSDVGSPQPVYGGTPDGGLPRGIRPDNLHFSNFSSEELPVADDAVFANAPRPYMARAHASSVSSVFLPPRALLHTRSQDQLHIPPPRPPRSPIEASFSPPVPPPRISSRISIQDGEFDPLAKTSVERPQTSGGFRPPAPMTFVPQSGARPPLAHAHSYSADLNTSIDKRRFSQMRSDPNNSMPSPPPAAPNDANWPLACSTAPTGTFDILPGVPEEEEQVYNHHRNSVRKSRLSVASNSSSLRKSHSLPLLQQFPPPQASGSQRPPSSASDTLGRFDLFAAQRALRESMANEDGESSPLPRESWEDDIDYCYEHEAEADCEYAWERPSLDLSREAVFASLDREDGNSSSSSNNSSKTQTIDSGAASNLSLNLLSPNRFDVPALSPASQTSAASSSEALTPTGLAMRRPPGLTIQTAMGEDALRPMHKFFHNRSGSRDSRALSFVESHGFNLSPSLFIPGSEKYERFHLPARGEPVGFAIGAPEDDEFPPYVEPTMTMNKSMLLVSTRSSASTTASRVSVDSMLSDRHISATSTATDLTRLTMSTSSIEDLVYKNEPEVPQI